LQIDVVLQVLNFLPQGHPVLLGLINHVAQQLGQGYKGGFGVVGFPANLKLASWGGSTVAGDPSLTLILLCSPNDRRG
jgi:hypothetical protein